MIFKEKKNNVFLKKRYFGNYKNISVEAVSDYL